MTKGHMGYLPIDLFCLIVLFFQLLYTRRSDFHVELGTTAHEEERISNLDTIKDLAYSFYIVDTNLGGYSSEGSNTRRVNAQGEPFKMSHDPKGYKQYQMMVGDDAEVFFSVSVSPKYDEKTMPTSEENKQGDADFYNDASIHFYENKIGGLSYEPVTGRHHVEGGALINDDEDNMQLFTVKTKNGKRDLTVIYYEESARN